MTLQVGDTVRVKAPDDGTPPEDPRWEYVGRHGNVIERHNANGRRWVIVAMHDSHSTIMFTEDGVERVELRQNITENITSDSSPLTVPLDAAIATLRQVLAIAAPHASVLRLQALVGMLAHAERCVRELPE